jgi:hypothetical protein
MALGRKVLLLALGITVLIFITILFTNSLFSSQRENALGSKMNDVVKEYEDMQTIILMSEFLGEDMTCPALEGMLQNMNTGLWDLGTKIDMYRQATEQFTTDPYYLQQKQDFNRKEVLYFLTLKKMKEKCSINQTIISFFYRKKEFCDKCDAQSFVLRDIKLQLEDLGKSDQIAIFSFDVDTNLTTVNLLTKYFNTSNYPCTVIENETLCGIKDKQELLDVICRKNRIAACS